MDCPHCGAETLMGATHCFACSRPLFGRPQSSPGPAPIEPSPAAFADTSSFSSSQRAEGTSADEPLPPRIRGVDEVFDSQPVPAPVDLPERHRPTLCKICFGPCTDRLTLVCDVCARRSMSSASSDDGIQAFGNKMGTAAFRPPPARRAPSAAARAGKAIFWGAVLVATGFGFVHFTRKPGAGASLAHDSRGETAAVAFAMPSDLVMRYSTTLDVRIHREEIPSSFDDDMMTIFDIHQISGHEAQVMLIRDDGESALLDVRTQCGVDSQDGIWEQKDGSDRPIYPWPDRLEIQRVRVRARGPMEMTAGGEPLPARDAPPFLVYGHTGGPSGELRPGSTWETEALLPCLVTRNGAIAPSAFTCRFSYVGKRLLEGCSCVILQLEATPVRDLDERFGNLDGVGGTVSGALAFDTLTGLLIEAELEVDTHVRRGGTEPVERVGMKGTLVVGRE